MKFTKKRDNDFGLIWCVHILKGCGNHYFMICVTTKTDYTLSCDWHPLIQPPFHANASNTHTRLNIFLSIERYQLCVCDCLHSASQVFNSEKAVYVWLGFEIVLDCPASIIFGLSKNTFNIEL